WSAPPARRDSASATQAKSARVFLFERTATVRERASSTPHCRHIHVRRVMSLPYAGELQRGGTHLCISEATPSLNSCRCNPFHPSLTPPHNLLQNQFRLLPRHPLRVLPLLHHRRDA